MIDLTTQGIEHNPGPTRPTNWALPANGGPPWLPGLTARSSRARCIWASIYHTAHACLASNRCRTKLSEYLPMGGSRCPRLLPGMFSCGVPGGMGELTLPHPLPPEA